MMTAPCHGCAERREGCHGGCERYQAYRAEREEIYRERREAYLRRVVRDEAYSKQERRALNRRKREGKTHG